MAASHPRTTLVLGGARSGKSRFAEDLVRAHPSPWLYIATAEALDEEMTARIEKHVSRRGAGWETIEVGPKLTEALRKEERAGRPILVDCLTLWLSNVMLGGLAVEPAIDQLCEAIADAPGPLYAISNEVGLGIVPETRLGREFRDAQGILNQRVAAVAEQVIFVAAGLPLVMKRT